MAEADRGAAATVPDAGAASGAQVRPAFPHHTAAVPVLALVPLPALRLTLRGCTRVHVCVRHDREVARLLQVEFADIAHAAAAGPTPTEAAGAEEDRRKDGGHSPAIGVGADTADFLALAGVAFAEEPPMSPAERNQHVTFILEWLRKRDRVINTVVTPTMHIACLNSDAGITVE